MERIDWMEKQEKHSQLVTCTMLTREMLMSFPVFCCLTLENPHLILIISPDKKKRMKAVFVPTQVIFLSFESRNLKKNVKCQEYAYNVQS